MDIYIYRPFRFCRLLPKKKKSFHRLAIEDDEEDKGDEPMDFCSTNLA